MGTGFTIQAGNKFQNLRRFVSLSSGKLQHIHGVSRTQKLWVLPRLISNLRVLKSTLLQLTLAFPNVLIMQINLKPLERLFDHYSASYFSFGLVFGIFVVIAVPYIMSINF